MAPSPSQNVIARRQKIVFGIALTVVILLPGAALSQRAPEGGIVPLEACSDKVICIKDDGTPAVARNVCDTCDIFALAKNVLDFIWYSISLPIAILMFAYAGFLMVVPGSTGDTPRYTKGKQIFKTTVFGLLIVFVAWLGIDTIIKGLGGFEPGFRPGPWYEINCREASAAADPKPCPKYQDVDEPELRTFEELEEGTERELRLRLDQHQVYVQRNNPCPPGVTYQEYATAHQDESDARDQGCTTISGLPAGTREALIELRDDCNCAMLITGGTEAGHRTHGPGRPIVDLDKAPSGNDPLSEYVLREGGSPVTNVNGHLQDTCSSFPCYVLGDHIFVDEGNHWHVIIDPADSWYE